MSKRENCSILILEDDFSFALDLEMMLDELNYKDITKVNSVEKALVYLKDNQPNLVLADIHLEGDLTGIDFAKLIANKDLPIVFFTSHHDMATFEEVRSIRPVAFLGKPIDKLLFNSTIQLALDKQVSLPESKETNLEDSQRFNMEDHLFIRANSNLEKVAIKDIHYIHSNGNYCYVHANNKKYILKTSLIKLSEQLPEMAFMRVHRSYLVQKEHIVRIETKANSIYMGKDKLPIGRNYKSEIIGQLNLLT